MGANPEEGKKVKEEVNMVSKKSSRGKESPGIET